MSPLPVKESDDAAAADGNADEVQLLRNPSPFIIRTYELVDDSAVDDIVSWNDDGSSFILWQPAKFARDLLPKYFKHNNFSSFVRQLNIYGFQKVVPHRWEFANDCFKRGHKQLLCGIQPRASKVTLGDDNSSELDVSRVGDLLQKGDVGISGTCSSRKLTSAVSSTNNQLLEKAQRDFALRNKKKREMKKRLRKSTEKFSGDSKDELGELEVEEVTMGDNPIQSSISTDFLADYSIDPCLDSQPLSLVFSSPDFKPVLSFDALYYCTLFPPRHEFEKDTLIQLWMANGFVVCEPMERIAAMFFDDCITEGYFKLSRFDLVSGNALYKLDRDNHLISSFISRGSDIIQIEGDSNLNNVSPAVSHVSIMCATLKDSTFHDLKRLEQLRTLVFLQAHTINFKQIPRDFFLMLKLLRVLDLSRTCLLELPSSIGNMKCLCFLDLSENPIKRLPEAMSCLENLQTLKLKGCLKLSALPKGMRKMTSLRHLDFDVLHQIRSMPQGMGALTNIRTLSAFLVGVEEGCSIRQLKNMNNLSGSFCISRLENVLTKDEAEEVCLSDKSQLQKLELHWSDSQEEGIVRYGEVLSSLQPNTSLEELNISCYGGFELPSWICDPAFSKLVSVTLFECENCLGLPSLGQLPSLKFLNITDFHKLKVIDRNFYGVLGIPGYVAFPKLENLTLENMSNLEEWLVNGSFDFPHLIKLTIKHCPKLYSLRTLSCLSSLENLEISHCTMLASCLDGNLPAGVETFIVEDCPLISAKFLNEGSQDWPKVAHIPHLWIDHQEMAFGQRSA